MRSLRTHQRSEQHEVGGDDVNGIAIHLGEHISPVVSGRAKEQPLTCTGEQLRRSLDLPVL